MGHGWSDLSEVAPESSVAGPAQTSASTLNQQSSKLGTGDSRYDGTAKQHSESGSPSRVYRRTWDDGSISDSVHVQEAAVKFFQSSTGSS